MYELHCDDPKIYSELLDVIKPFFPAGDNAVSVCQNALFQGSLLKINTVVNGKASEDFYDTPDGSDQLLRTRVYLRARKLSLYKALSGATGRVLPWGSLTGIRPTKIAYELLLGGTDIADIAGKMRQTYLVSADKAELVHRILKAQQGAYVKDDSLVNLYVHIPFCTSRCNYCSFPTTVLTPRYTLAKPYADALVREIQATLAFLKANSYRVCSVYVGGGTPTALGAEELGRVLGCVNATGEEFTCEAGRPDTVTEEKLKIMADNGVNRISINPQSLNDRTLESIGRKHTAAQFFYCFEAARHYPFDINTDLIAGLDGERIDDFRATVRAVTALRPENITVHTLARKNGSEIMRRGYEGNADIEEMVNYSGRALTEAGYTPYYLYRQKQMLGNLENTGYCLPEKRCVNNITTMEECLSVVGCGCGAISKRVYVEGNRIERLANLRDVKLYLQQFEERLEKKLAFFENTSAK